MDAFMDSVGSIFRGGDVLPWCDRDIIAVSSFVLPAPRAPLSPRFSPGDHGSASAASLGRPGDECPPPQFDPFFQIWGGGMRASG